MKIKALFFAACRDIVGNRELDLDVGEGSQVEDLKNVLLVKYPELATINMFCRLQSMQSMLTAMLS